jgi:hypothetical protein
MRDWIHENWNIESGLWERMEILVVDERRIDVSKREAGRI